MESIALAIVRVLNGIVTLYIHLAKEPLNPINHPFGALIAPEKLFEESFNPMNHPFGSLPHLLG